MNCAWEEYLNILPPRLRPLINEIGADILQDVRLRLHQKPVLLTSNGQTQLKTDVSIQDLQYCINAASEYSPWSAKTMTDGFITARGGHRIGVCGEAVISDNGMRGIRTVTSLAIRVARDFEGIAAGLEKLRGSILIIGSPGTGKTTLLRDLIRRKSNMLNECISVVDERQELFPINQHGVMFSAGKNTDVLSGCSKPHGITTVLRNMGPTVIAVDEITDKDDCQSLLEAAWCGVDLIATAHARNKEEFETSVIYRPLIDCKIFQNLVILRRDKSWYTERILYGN